MAKFIHASRRTLEGKEKHQGGEKSKKSREKITQAFGKDCSSSFPPIHLSIIYLFLIVPQTMCNLVACIFAYMLGASLYSCR